MQQNAAPEAMPTPPMNNAVTQTGKKHVTGPAVAVLIVLVALFLGGLYLWGSMLPEETTPENLGSLKHPTRLTTTTTTTTTTDDLGAIETALNATASSTTDNSAAIDAALKP